MAQDDDEMTVTVSGKLGTRKLPLETQVPSLDAEDNGALAPRPIIRSVSTRGYVPMPSESALETVEVEGDAVPQYSPTESGLEGIETSEALHEEVAGGGEGGEAAEEGAAEASAEQLLAAEAGDTAESDLRGIEGYSPIEVSEGAESAEETTEALAEAGAALERAGESAQAEFLPVLASLIPTLVSTVGPMVARAVTRKLSSRTQQAVVKRIAARPVRPVPRRSGGVAANATIQNILQLLVQALQRSESSQMGESAEAAEVVEAQYGTVIESAAAALEVIIGTDDRVRITNTTTSPWRRYCALRITFPSGRTYRGTGFFIGPRAVATAGHCVYLHSEGGWASREEVIPGMSGDTRPFGSAVGVSLRSVRGWVQGKRPESDYGCIILPHGAFGGRDLGRFGFAALSTSALLAKPAVLAGYPGDKRFAELWGMKRRLKRVTASTLVYDIDTMGGQSGAPVYIKRNGKRYVIGIHNYGEAAGNSATRVTEPVYNRLLAWSKIS